MNETIDTLQRGLEQSEAAAPRQERCPRRMQVMRVSVNVLVAALARLRRLLPRHVRLQGQQHWLCRLSGQMPLRCGTG